MYLDEFEAEIKKVVRAVDNGDRSQERGVEIIDHLIDEFSVRFESRSDIVRYTKLQIARMQYGCAADMAAAIPSPEEV